MWIQRLLSTTHVNGTASGYPRVWYTWSVLWVWAAPSAHSYEFVGTFLCAQMDLREARGRELATLDQTSTSSGVAKSYAWQKFKARTEGEKGLHLWPHGLSKSRKVKVWEKKRRRKDTLDYMISGNGWWFILIPDDEEFLVCLECLAAPQSFILDELFQPGQCCCWSVCCARVRRLYGKMDTK